MTFDISLPPSVSPESFHRKLCETAVVRSHQLLDDQPPFPYNSGSETEIYSHVPPEPLMGSLMHANDHDFFQVRTRFEAVLDRPPRRTQQHSEEEQRSSQDSLRLNITKTLRVGRAAGAQVILCDIESDNRPKFQAIAKIYDALYYRLT